MIELQKIIKLGLEVLQMKEPIELSDSDKLKILEERMNFLLLELNIVKNLLEDIVDQQQDKIKIPHRCPICNGTIFDEEGSVGFCLPCEGKGIVWG